MEAKEEGTKLVITIDLDEQHHLQSLQDEPDFGSDAFMHDLFESIIANSDYEWIDPSITGDLTDAPMLGLLGPEEAGAGSALLGALMVGRYPDVAGVVQTWYQPVLKRWAFMDYQVRCPQEDLAETGRCEFVSE